MTTRRISSKGSLKRRLQTFSRPLDCWSSKASWAAFAICEVFRAFWSGRDLFGWLFLKHPSVFIFLFNEFKDDMSRQLKVGKRDGFSDVTLVWPIFDDRRTGG